MWLKTGNKLYNLDHVRQIEWHDKMVQIHLSHSQGWREVGFETPEMCEKAFALVTQSLMAGIRCLDLEQALQEQE